MHKSDNVGFSAKVLVGKSLQKSIVLEGKEVPIIHQYGKQGFTSYPKLRVNLAQAIAKVNQKLFGIPANDKFWGTERIIVEKYKEIYHPGIGHDAVHKLNQLGYGYRQIIKKIGKPVLKEINIHHAIKAWKPGWLNLMLNEGIDQVWDLVAEIDNTNYYTNALARVGVGNSNTAPVATQTGLLGGSTAFAAMEGGFPTTATAQRIDFKGSFGNGVAEFAWEEFTVDNGNTSNKNLQRLIASKGTKTAGETWTAEIQITGS